MVPATSYGFQKFIERPAFHQDFETLKYSDQSIVSQPRKKYLGQRSIIPDSGQFFASFRKRELTEPPHVPIIRPSKGTFGWTSHTNP